MGEILMKKLTKREIQLVELFAWGASKKEAAAELHVSERTIENHARSIYSKLGIGKVNELSAWWFCTRFNISFDLSPFKRAVVSFIFLLILLPQLFYNNTITVYRRRTATIARTYGHRRKTDNNFKTYNYT